MTLPPAGTLSAAHTTLAPIFSLAKETRLPTSFHLGEGVNLELRASFFHIFDKLNLAPFQFGDASTTIL